ncbi:MULTISPECIES: DUF998 domain-containing protein [unclassified Nocardioides]|uniref:DUF998 domain-containing protein n=1 Tax=unclassified Nocardioides TaxID=2615069 RepID=UPI0006FE1549|nr:MULTISPECIES: DUF998 domain-containing protein [unclassified Nocardioides]KQY64220.1 hypothetical protein ASD30_04525 [Nocardioides sp. Root140]KQZ70140.1 hypothetical protein ASD66_10785 [Nocardioides sp. Root151]
MSRAHSGAPNRPWALACLVGCLAFWAFDALAVLLSADDYSARRDLVSSLAGRGSSVGWLGELAIAAYVVGHTSACVLMLRAWRTKVAGAFVGQGAFLMAGILLFRGNCPQGEAGCGRGANHVVDLGTTLHSVFGNLYLWTMLIGLLVASVSAIWEHGVHRLTALLAIPTWLLSTYAASRWLAQGGHSDGLWERVWLGSHAAWFVVIAVVVLARRRTDAHAPA